MRTVDRRLFMRESALLVGAFASRASTSRGMQQPEKHKAGPNDVLRAAVLGVRGRGMEHLDSFTKLPDVRVTTIRE